MFICQITPLWKDLLGYHVRAIIAALLVNDPLGRYVEALCTFDTHRLPLLLGRDESSASEACWNVL